MKKKLMIIMLLWVFPVFAETRDKSHEKAVSDIHDLFNNLPTPVYQQFIDNKNGLSFDSMVINLYQTNGNILLNNQDIAVGQGRLLQSGLWLNPNLETEIGTNAIIDRGNDYDVNLTYTHPIELFGKPGKRYKLAELQLEALKNEVNFRNQQYISEIKSQYINTLIEAESLKIAEQLLTLNTRLLKLTEARYTNGDTSKFDTNLIRIEVNRLKGQQLLAENRVRSSLIKLKNLLGLDINNELKLSSKLFSTSLLPEKINLKNIQDIAVKNRFDFKASVIIEEVSQARITELEAEANPNINVFGKYSRQKSTFDNTSVGNITDTDNTLTAGVSFDLPIFNRNQGNIMEAKALYKQSQIRKELLEQEIKRDVTLAFNNMILARQAVLLFENQILKYANENLWITRQTYELGEQALIFLMIEQTRMADIQKEFINVLREYNFSIVDLEKVVSISINTIISELNLKGEKK